MLTGILVGGAKARIWRVLQSYPFYLASLAFPPSLEIGRLLSFDKEIGRPSELGGWFRLQTLKLEIQHPKIDGRQG